MGLFSSPEDKAMEALQKHHLENISPKYAEAVQEINLELVGTGAMELGAKLSFAKNEELLKISYLRTLVEQNWIIIRMLDDLNNK